MKRSLIFVASAFIVDLIALFSSAVRVATAIAFYRIGFSSKPIVFYLELLPLIISLVLLPLLAWKLLTLLRGGGSKMS